MKAEEQTPKIKQQNYQKQLNHKKQIQINQFFPQEKKQQIQRSSKTKKKSEISQIQKEQFSKDDWNFQDQQNLIKLYKKYGNNWSKISKFYNKKTDSYVKNRFYCKLRKSIRLLNKFIHHHYKQIYRPLILNTIFKLTKLTEQNPLQTPILAVQIFNYYKQLIYRCIQFHHLFTNVQETLQCQKKQAQNLILSLCALQEIYKFIECHKRSKNQKQNSDIYSNGQNYLVLTPFKCQICYCQPASFIYQRQMSLLKEESKNNFTQSSLFTQSSSEKYLNVDNFKILKSAQFSNDSEFSSGQSNLEEKQTQNLTSQYQVSQELRFFHNFYFLDIFLNTNCEEMVNPSKNIEQKYKKESDQQSQIVQIYSIQNSQYKQQEIYFSNQKKEQQKVFKSFL